MARIHGVDTSWSNYTGNYSQRDVDDKEKFANNWDLIFGKKNKPQEEKEDNNASPQSNG
jgi:hypothetical protein